MKKVNRYISLRERTPNTKRFITPYLRYCETAESPVRKAYILEIDENGFHRPSKIHDNPDLSIVFLGGSTTECMFVNQLERFPYLVGRYLEEKTGLKINSFNSGVSENNALHSINILLNKVVPIRPKFVVFMQNCNDLHTLSLENTYWTDNPDMSVIVGSKKTNLLKVVSSTMDPWLCDMYYVLTRELSRMRSRVGVRNPNPITTTGSKAAFDFKKAVNDYISCIKIFIYICQALNIIPILMTECNRYTDEPSVAMKEYIENIWLNFGIRYAEFRTFYDELNSIVRTIGRESETMVIDLDRQIPKTRQYLYDHVHLNEMGSHLAAEIITNNIYDLLQKRGKTA